MSSLSGEMFQAPRPRRYWGRAIGALIRDLPLFLTAPLFRRWHLRWGATPDEVAARLPGDGRFVRPQFVATRAITIQAPPERVWPWLVQVGCRRAGWYSHDLLDNLGRASADAILPQCQDLAVGQWVPMSPLGSINEVSAFRVEDFATHQWLLWAKPDSTWVWRLTPTPDGGTRLVTRVQAPRDWRHEPAMALLGVALMEFGDFAMMRRMLLGIKARVEAAEGNLAEPPHLHRSTTLALIGEAATTHR